MDVCRGVRDSDFLGPLRQLKRHALLDGSVRIDHEPDALLRTEAVRLEENVVCADRNAWERVVPLFVRSGFRLKALSRVGDGNNRSWNGGAGGVGDRTGDPAGNRSLGRLLNDKKC